MRVSAWLGIVGCVLVAGLAPVMLARAGGEPAPKSLTMTDPKEIAEVLRMRMPPAQRTAELLARAVAATKRAEAAMTKAQKAAAAVERERQAKLTAQERVAEGLLVRKAMLDRDLAKVPKAVVDGRLADKVFTDRLTETTNAISTATARPAGVR